MTKKSKCLRSGLKDDAPRKEDCLHRRAQDDAKKLAEEAGAKVAGSVTGQTDILVCVAWTLGRRRQRIAAKNGVAVWSEDYFMSAVGGEGGGQRGGEQEARPCLFCPA